jgi:hypothetical protein
MRWICNILNFPHFWRMPTLIYDVCSTLFQVLSDLYYNVSQVIKNAFMQDLVMFGLAMQNAAVPTSQTNPLMSTLQNKVRVIYWK